VFEDLGIQHAMPMRHFFVICALSRSAVLFHMISQRALNWGNHWTIVIDENNRCL